MTQPPGVGEPGGSRGIDTPSTPTGPLAPGPRRRTRRWAAGLAVLVLALAGLTVYLVSALGPGSSGNRIAALQQGDCVRGSFGEPDPQPTAVPCDGEYDAEVLDTFALPAGPYPARDQLSDQAAKGCRERFEASGGPVLEPPDLWLVFPTSKAAWDAGDRTVVCLIKPSGP